MAIRKKKINQLAKLHLQQDKNNAFVGVGDIVRVRSKVNEIFEGEITCIDIKKEGDHLHAVMDLKLPGLKTSQLSTENQASFWLESIAELEIIRFKGEE